MEYTKPLKSVLRDLDTVRLSSPDKDIRASMDMAKIAVFKMIPTPVEAETRYYGIGKCPRCGAVFMDRLTKCCGNCGQAITFDTNRFKKKDLKPGMACVTRGGDVCLVIPDMRNAEPDVALVTIDDGKVLGVTHLSEMNDTLEDKDGYTDFDVVKVYGLSFTDGFYFSPDHPERYRELLWEETGEGKSENEN